MKFFLIRRLLYTKRKQDFNEGIISTYSSCESGEKFSNILCNACTDINKKVVHFIFLYVFNFVGTASLHKMDVNQREDAASPARGVRASLHKESAVCGYQHRDHTAEYGDMEGRHWICHRTRYVINVAELSSFQTIFVTVLLLNKRYNECQRVFRYYSIKFV